MIFLFIFFSGLDDAVDADGGALAGALDQLDVGGGDGGSCLI